MERTDRHIFDLLFQHDCVILPGLGGFVADYKVSRLDEETAKIYPPSKSFIFNKHLLNNDGLLANKIADEKGVSYSEAMREVETYISEIKNRLQKEKRYELDQVGILFQDISGNLRFKPARTNFLLNSFGLPVVKAIPVVVEKPIEKEEKVTKVKPIEIKHDTEKLLEEETKVIAIDGGRKRSYWWVAAAAIPVLFYSAWIPLKTDLFKDKGNFHYSDLNPFTFNKERLYHKENISTVSIEKITETPSLEKLSENGDYVVLPLDEAGHYVTVKLHKEEIIPEIETTFVEKEIIEEPIVVTGNYHLIGGCFSKIDNAESFVEEMKGKGYNAFILDQHKGLNRVSIMQAPSRNEAKELRSELKTKDISSWVLKK